MPEAATKFTPTYYKDLAGKLKDWGRDAKALIPSLLEYGDWDEKKAKLDAQLAAKLADVEAGEERLRQINQTLEEKKLAILRAEDELKAVQNDVERNRKTYHELELSIRKFKRDNRIS